MSDQFIRRENVRMCFQLDLFHLLTIKDLEDEVKRLNEKQERYLQLINECTLRNEKRIDQIKSVLEKLK